MSKFDYQTERTPLGTIIRLTIPEAIAKTLEGGNVAQRDGLSVYPLTSIQLDPEGLDNLTGNLEALADVPADRIPDARAKPGIAHAARWTLDRIARAQRGQQWPDYRKPTPKPARKRHRATKKPTTRSRGDSRARGRRTHKT